MKTTQNTLTQTVHQLDTKFRSQQNFLTKEW
jgi:hypothetical protein